MGTRLCLGPTREEGNTDTHQHAADARRDLAAEAHSQTEKPRETEEKRLLRRTGHQVNLDMAGSGNTRTRTPQVEAGIIARAGAAFGPMKTATSACGGRVPKGERSIVPGDND